MGVGCVGVYMYFHMNIRMNIQSGAYMQCLVDQRRATGRTHQDALDMYIYVYI